jgi:hypothetical protein
MELSVSSSCFLFLGVTARGSVTLDASVGARTRGSALLDGTGGIVAGGVGIGGLGAGAGTGVGMGGAAVGRSLVLLATNSLKN